MQKFFVIMVIFVCGLLFYANGIAFNLFSAPIFANDIIAYAALTAAVTIAVITLMTVFRDIRKGISLKSQIIEIVKETKGTLSTVPLPVNTQKNTNNPHDELPKAITLEQPLKQLKPKRTKLICPACRREFEMPTFLGELMVDFGPRNPSNLIKTCLHCGAIIALKQKGASEIHVWKE